MNRTIKLQFFNLKRNYLYSALFMYGIVALFWLIAYLVDGAEFYSIMTTQPTWLAILTFIFMPFTFLALLYPLFDGLILFDTSLRFGVSRQSYFITQLIIYVGLTLMLVIGNGLTEIPWSGTTTTYFSQFATDYLSFENIAIEFIKILAIGIIMLAVYRFKVKALIPFILVGPILGIIIGASFRLSESTFLVDRMIDMVEFVMNNPELFMSILIVVLIGIYYLFITKTEVQD